jgi:hypothetical protein
LRSESGTGAPGASAAISARTGASKESKASAESSASRIEGVHSNKSAMSDLTDRRVRMRHDLSSVDHFQSPASAAVITTGAKILAATKIASTPQCIEFNVTRQLQVALTMSSTI